MSPPAVVRGAEEQLARVTGRGASLEGDHGCAAMERAITQQPTDRGGINVVGASDISLRLASGEVPHGFLPLMRRHLARAAEPNAARLGALAALASPGADCRLHGRHENGTSLLLIVADHAGRLFPRRLGQLGLSILWGLHRRHARI
jgi:hypothetical protein